MKNNKKKNKKWKNKKEKVFLQLAAYFRPRNKTLRPHVLRNPPVPCPPIDPTLVP